MSIFRHPNKSFVVCLPRKAPLLPVLFTLPLWFFVPGARSGTGTQHIFDDSESGVNEVTGNAVVSIPDVVRAAEAGQGHFQEAVVISGRAIVMARVVGNPRVI